MKSLSLRCFQRYALILNISQAPDQRDQPKDGELNTKRLALWGLSWVSIMSNNLAYFQLQNARRIIFTMIISNNE